MTDAHNPFAILGQGPVPLPEETPRLVAVGGGDAIALGAEFGFEGHAAAPAEVIGRCAELKPKVLVIDPVLPGLDGLAVLNDILTLAPDTAVVLIRGEGDTYARIARGVARLHPTGALYIAEKARGADGVRAALTAIAEAGNSPE